MKVTKKKLKDYLQDAKNFNRGTEYGEGLIEKSVSRFGAGRSMLASSDGVLIAGNKSHQKLAEAGIENVIEVETDGKTAVVVKRTDIKSGTKKFHELALADNATSKANLNFDETLVEEILTEEVMLEWGVGNPKAEEDDYTPPPLEQIKTDIVNGDIFEITDGKLTHRLLCGDSSSPDEIAALMKSQKADMMFTDPPYQMAMGGQGCFVKSTRNVKNRIDDIIDFNPKTISFFLNIDCPTYYIFTSKDLIKEYLDIFKECNFNILFWAKTNPIPFTSGTFLPDIEYILFFTKKGKKIWNNSLTPTDIYKKYYVGKKLEGRQEDGDLHPTMKPIGLVSDKIKISSNLNGIVLDPFLGSGTTMVAGHQLGRNVYGIEIMPAYCQIILDRMAKLDNSLKFTKNGKPYKISPINAPDKETGKPSTKGTSLKTAAKEAEING